MMDIRKASQGPVLMDTLCAQKCPYRPSIGPEVPIIFTPGIPLSIPQSVRACAGVFQVFMFLLSSVLLNIPYTRLLENLNSSNITQGFVLAIRQRKFVVSYSMPYYLSPFAPTEATFKKVNLIQKVVKLGSKPSHYRHVRQRTDKSCRPPRSIRAC